MCDNRCIWGTEGWALNLVRYRWTMLDLVLWTRELTTNAENSERLSRIRSGNATRPTIWYPPGDNTLIKPLPSLRGAQNAQPNDNVTEKNRLRTLTAMLSKWIGQLHQLFSRWEGEQYTLYHSRDADPAKIEEREHETIALYSHGKRHFLRREGSFTPLQGDKVPLRPKEHLFEVD